MTYEVAVVVPGPIFVEIQPFIEILEVERVGHVPLNLTFLVGNERREGCFLPNIAVFWPHELPNEPFKADSDRRWQSNVTG